MLLVVGVGATLSEAGLGAKAVAMLGVLAATGAGLLSGATRLRGRTELALLAAYGFVAAFASG